MEESKAADQTPVQVESSTDNIENIASEKPYTQTMRDRRGNSGYPRKMRGRGGNFGQRTRNNFNNNGGSNDGYQESKRRKFDDNSDTNSNTQNSEDKTSFGNYDLVRIQKMCERNYMFQPTFDLPVVDTSEQKFSTRSRLYVGNLSNDTNANDLEEIFKPYGETTNIFINTEKKFAFVTFDYLSNAKKAKQELDGSILKLKHIRIRLAPAQSSVKVKNFTSYVTNELLVYAFSIFGKVERAQVFLDQRGNSTGEAIVDFTSKRAAVTAIRSCLEGCFFLTSSLRPCIVEPYEYPDDSITGFSEENIQKTSQGYQNERAVGPRFAKKGTFEEKYGMLWIELYRKQSEKEAFLKRSFELEMEKLKSQMEYAKYEHETEELRNTLRMREMNKQEQKREWEMRERQIEEERQRTEENINRIGVETDMRMFRGQEVIKRKEEEKLFLQARNLDSMLDLQEKGYEHQSTELPQSYEQGCSASNSSNFSSAYARQPSTLTYPKAENGGVWVTDTRQKRRRFNNNM